MPLNPLHADYLPTKVVSVAKGFVGLTEIGNNAGFAPSEFQREMQKVGWAKGQPWCSYLVELIIKTALLAENRKVVFLIVPSILTEFEVSCPVPKNDSIGLG